MTQNLTFMTLDVIIPARINPIPAATITAAMLVDFFNIVLFMLHLQAGTSMTINNGSLYYLNIFDKMFLKDKINQKQLNF